MTTRGISIRPVYDGAIATDSAAADASAPVQIGGGAPLALIAGPCVIESPEHLMMMAESITAITRELGLPLVFKSSFEKANRTSAHSFRGLGREAGLAALAAVKRRLGVPILTDVHTESDVEVAAGVVDVLQIPAFLCRQTSLLEAAGSTGKCVLIKKGQFLAPEDMRFAAEKVRGAGKGSEVLLCERGACFGYRELVVDFRGLAVMRESGWPVVFDATHSVQVMGGAGGSSGGNRRYVPLLARAAVAAGVDAVFLEVHDNPDAAPSDGPNMLPLTALREVLEDLMALDRLALHTRE